MIQREIEFKVEYDSDGGFVATAVGHAIVTQGETIEELRRMIEGAVLCHFGNSERPQDIRLI